MVPKCKERVFEIPERVHGASDKLRLETKGLNKAVYSTVGIGEPG